MDQLTLPEKFALITLNGKEVRPQEGQSLWSRCLAASQLLEFVLSEKMIEINNQYCFVYDAPSELKGSELLLYELIGGPKVRYNTLKEWGNLLAEIPLEKAANWVETVLEKMIKDSLVKTVSAGIKGKEKRFDSSDKEYKCLIDQVREGTQLKEVPSNEWLALVWLLDKTGSLSSVLTQHEYLKTLEILTHIRIVNTFVNNLMDITIKEDKIPEKGNFLTRKLSGVRFHKKM